MDATAETDFLSIEGLLKAMPREEGGRRFVYMEASNESRDHDGEVVLCKALEASAAYYLRFGNVDLDHRTAVGPVAGQPSHHLFEIGKPIEVKVDAPRTFVKAEIYSGDSPVAENANLFWDSLTKVRPPQRWYPSVGGQCSRSVIIDPVTKEPRKVIGKVRWTNIGMSRTPTNLEVPTAATVPFGALAKSLGMSGFSMRKAIEAGYGTDVSELAGGAALREQSLDDHVQSYWDFRDRLAGDIRRKSVTPAIDAMVAHSSAKYGLEPHVAAKHVERFLADLKRGRQQRIKH
jgi:hypothetical protein